MNPNRYTSLPTPVSSATSVVRPTTEELAFSTFAYTGSPTAPAPVVTYTGKRQVPLFHTVTLPGALELMTSRFASSVWMPVCATPISPPTLTGDPGTSGADECVLHGSDILLCGPLG